MARRSENPTGMEWLLIGGVVAACGVAGYLIYNASTSGSAGETPAAEDTSSTTPSGSETQAQVNSI